MFNIMNSRYNGCWYLREEDEFLAVKHFQDSEELTNYITTNKEIKNYNISSNSTLEISLEDYLSLPKKLKNP